jgi:hypothetical protein
MLLVVCLLAAAPGAVVAQTPATTWQEFMPLAEIGKSLKVNDHQGQSMTGRVEQVTASGIDLVMAKGQRRTVPAADVVRVVRLDANLNGMLLGLAGGIGAGAATGRSGCRADPSCSAAQLAVALPIGAAAGVLIGYLVDASHTRTLFRRDTRSSVVVAPLIGRGQVGVRMAVGWQ